MTDQLTQESTIVHGNSGTPPIYTTLLVERKYLHDGNVLRFEPILSVWSGLRQKSHAFVRQGAYFFALVDLNSVHSCIIREVHTKARTMSVSHASTVAFVNNTPGDVLCTVAAICARKWPDAYHLEVMSKISAFIPIHPSWTICRASTTGSPRLMRILLSRRACGIDDDVVTAFIYNRGLDIAAAAGSLRLCQKFAQYFPNVVITSAAATAARKGHVSILRWLLQRDLVVWSKEAVVRAAQAGKASGVMQLLRGLQVSPHPSLLFVALARGHDTLAKCLWLSFASVGDFNTLKRALAAARLPLAKWMDEHSPLDFALVPVCVDKAAARGDIEWLQWSQRRRTIATVNAMDDAAANGHIRVVIWLHENRWEGCSTRAMDGAAKGGHLSVLRWIWRTRGQEWTSEALFNAAINGYLDVLVWLVNSSSVTCPDATFDYAASQGHLAVVHYMTFTLKSPASHRAMDWAASNGHLDVVCFLHEYRHEGCSTAAMNGAAANGHLQVVTWLHFFRMEGCTTNAVDYAALGNHVNVLEFLYALRPEGCTPSALLNAVNGASIDTVEWLIESFDILVTTDIVDAAIARGDVPLAHYFIEGYGVPWTHAGVDAAVIGGHVEILVYLNNRTAITCSATAVASAIQSGNLYAASWAYRNCRDTIELSAFRQDFSRLRWSDDIVRATFH
jgi:hypothetical protein